MIDGRNCLSLNNLREMLVKVTFDRIRHAKFLWQIQFRKHTSSFDEQWVRPPSPGVNIIKPQRTIQLIKLPGLLRIVANLELHSLNEQLYKHISPKLPYQRNHLATTLIVLHENYRVTTDAATKRYSSYRVTIITDSTYLSKNQHQLVAFHIHIKEKTNI